MISKQRTSICDRTPATTQQSGPPTWAKGARIPEERLEGWSPWPSTAGSLTPVSGQCSVHAQSQQDEGARSGPDLPVTHRVRGAPIPLDPGAPEWHPGPRPGLRVSWGRELRSKESGRPHTPSPGEHSKSPQGCRQSGPLPAESTPGRTWTS